MKITLIAPAVVEEKRRGMQGRVFQLPPLALATVAAATPEYAKVSIVDESIDPIDYNCDADLVGITALTRFAPHAYEIADRFREKGVKVVMGGMHPSALPKEAIKHCDSVVIGEAEGTWTRLIRDFEKGRMKKFYRNRGFVDLSAINTPRRDLYKKERYLFTHFIQTTRGCPFNCGFCSVTKFFGRTYRTRPVESVISEIRNMKTKFVGFSDDNIFGNRIYARKLFSALKYEGVVWLSQASLNIADDQQLLRLAARSGCRGLFIGLESVDYESLTQMNKGFLKPQKFKGAIKRLHDYGISVLGAFVLGNDNEDPSIFKRTLDFAKKIKIDLAQFAILTPYPGTAIYNRLTKEKRIFNFDWTKYDAGNAVYKPLKMTADKLKEEVDKLWRDFYRFDAVIVRVLRLGRRIPLQLLPLLLINFSFRKEIAATQDL
ncbi:MAG: B12-binding domain-containing radical SAM protein [candidate division WOR-3 bacterium]|nr:MAG: B12-binding domain-containing radical SAM protein [candidate division WOR-3 bacterium]